MTKAERKIVECLREFTGLDRWQCSDEQLLEQNKSMLLVATLPGVSWVTRVSSVSLCRNARN